jgi:hypothetical protein
VKSGLLLRAGQKSSACTTLDSIRASYPAAQTLYIRQCEP